MASERIRTMLENIREPQERNYTTEREMLVEGVVVAPVFGKAWAQWVYPVPLLDEAMERVSTNGGL
jgi:hypothetical protein